MSKLSIAAMASRMVPGEKLPSPKGLTAKERKEWASIVDPMPSGFFTPEMAPLLRSMVKAIMYARRLEDVCDEMMRDSLKWPLEDERWLGLHAQMRILQSWHDKILQWSRALRLTKQARYPGEKANVTTRRTTTAAKPWEDWIEPTTAKASERGRNLQVDH